MRRFLPLKLEESSGQIEAFRQRANSDFQCVARPVRLDFQGPPTRLFDFPRCVFKKREYTFESSMSHDRFSCEVYLQFLILTIWLIWSDCSDFRYALFDCFADRDV